MSKRLDAKVARDRRHDEHARAWHAACELFQSLQSGQPLAPLPYTSGLLLKADEAEYAAADAESYRYYGLQGGSYVHSTFLMGGPFMMAATGIASAVGNRSRRTAAEFEAMPRWRFGGHTRAVLTSARVLTCSEGQWISFYLGGIVEICPHPANYSVTMAFEDCAPLSLRGPWIPYLSIALFYLLHGRADPRAIEVPPADASPTRPTWP